MVGSTNKFMSVVLVVILVGCSATSQKPMVTPTIQPTVTLFPTVTPIFVTPFVTPTLAPTFTPSSTSTSLPLRTPLPTLSGEEDFLNFISFIGEEDCQLPCWVGIIPGKTSWNEAIFALHPIESVAKIKIHLDVEGLFGKENVITWSFSGDGVIANGDVGAVIVNQNVVNLMSMSIEGWTTPNTNAPLGSLSLPKSFNMQSVLKEYGVPSMVFIYTFIHDQLGPLPFSVLLVYPENHFYIIYQRDAKLSGNTVEACGPDSYLELAVVDGRDKLASADAIANTPETKSVGIQNMKPVEQVLNISPEKFYEIYSTSSLGCITFPTKNWSP